MRYTVYHRWEAHDEIPSTDGAYKVGISVDADSPEKAARQRIRTLGRPQDYTGLLVVGRDQDVARVFDVVVKHTPTIDLVPR